MPTEAENIKLSENEDGQVEIEAEINPKNLGLPRKETLKRLSQTLSLPGFRTGHIPENIIVAKIGEMDILEETVKRIIDDVAQKILTSKSLKTIGVPEILITKLAPNQPVEFKIKVQKYPEMTLPDYKRIAAIELEKPSEPPDVTESELVETIKQIWKNRQTAAKPVASRHPQTEETGKSGSKTKESEKKDDDPPPLDDDSVKTLGNFSDVADFKSKLKESILFEKSRRAKDKKRLAIIEKIMSEAKIKIPEAISQNETDRLLHQFRADVETAGLKFADYLKKINKSEADLEKEFKPEGERRAKLQLTLDEIAMLEKIVPTDEEIGHEAEHLIKHYPDADKDRIRAYTELVVTNEKVFQFLENQKRPPAP